MEPLDVYYWIFYKAIAYFAKKCAANFTDPKFKSTIRTYFIIGWVSSYAVCSFYTCLFYDIEACIKCVACFAVSLQVSEPPPITIQGIALNITFYPQGYAKFYTTLIHKNELRDKVEFLGVLYTTNTQNSPNKDVLRRCAEANVIIIKLLFLVYFSAFIAFTSMPFLFYWIYGIREPMLTGFIPGLNENTLRGYLILFGYHLFNTIIALCGTCAVDFCFFSLILHLWPMSRIFDLAIGNLNGSLAQYGNDADISQHCKMLLKNILLLHKEYDQ